MPFFVPNGGAWYGPVTGNRVWCHTGGQWRPVKALWRYRPADPDSNPPVAAGWVIVYEAPPPAPTIPAPNGSIVATPASGLVEVFIGNRTNAGWRVRGTITTTEGGQLVDSFTVDVLASYVSVTTGAATPAVATATLYFFDPTTGDVGASTTFTASW